MNGRERLMGAGQKHIGIDGVLGLFRDPGAEEIGHEGRDKEQRWAR